MKWILVFASILLSGCSSAPDRPPAEKAPPAAPPVKILQFYASPPTVAKGESVLLCYGVENATAVRLDPPVERITPSLNRCVQDSPQQTSTYTLLATGANGTQASQTVNVKVEGRAKAAAGTAAGAGLIQFFAASTTQIHAGQPVTLCYSLQGAQSVRVEPSVQQLEAVAKSCFTVAPRQTTTYTLTATGSNGKSDREKVQIRVE